MSEMVERVADLIATIVMGYSGEYCLREDVADEARRVIQAMREPSEAMVIAGQKQIPPVRHYVEGDYRARWHPDPEGGERAEQPWSYAKAAYAAMIDEALK